MRANRSKENRRARTRETNSNASNGYSKLFQQLRANQAPPCSLLRIGNALTGNMEKIHEEFASRWEEVFNRLKSNPPDYDTFVGRYGKYLKCNEAGDRLPNATELHEAAKRSKGTAAGIDGWLPAEVALLPLAAWEKRAMHLRMVAGEWRMARSILPGSFTMPTENGQARS